MQSALRALVERELVTRGAGRDYRISEPFFAEWIRAIDQDPEELR